MASTEAIYVITSQLQDAMLRVTEYQQEEASAAVQETAPANRSKKRAKGRPRARQGEHGIGNEQGTTQRAGEASRNNDRWLAEGEGKGGDYTGSATFATGPNHRSSCTSADTVEATAPANDGAEERATCPLSESTDEELMDSRTTRKRAREASNEDAPAGPPAAPHTPEITTGVTSTVHATATQGTSANTQRLLHLSRSSAKSKSQEASSGSSSATPQLQRQRP
ncbi:uncharacterized protein LOC119391646 [Rhipicephalus sanguineus]|uniref:uncharacterized protein LOC119391646 n=1 Tax=Rhipicephalus sanguineus TaxID=34632 RepID=UPI0018962B6F|nr:uncharacterized protein LOC119391646 [Rhipicephalus sanguineus]